MEVIKTKNLILRSVRKNDAAVLTAQIKHPTISRNTATIPYPYNLNDAESWIKSTMAEYRKKEPNRNNFIIEIDGQLAGGIGLHSIKKNHKAEIGYWLGKKYWGKGIIIEAVKAVTRYGIKRYKLKRVYAGVFSFNPASMRVLEKAGYKFEGIEKKAVMKKGRYIDKYIYAYVK